VSLEDKKNKGSFVRLSTCLNALTRFVRLADIGQRQMCATWETLSVIFHSTSIFSFDLYTAIMWSSRSRFTHQIYVLSELRVIKSIKAA